MNPTEEGLLGAIAKDPDNSHRLVYADWLEENGDPQRAEFFRLQLHLARLARQGPWLQPALVRAPGRRGPGDALRHLSYRARGTSISLPW